MKWNEYPYLYQPYAEIYRIPKNVPHKEQVNYILSRLGKRMKDITVIPEGKEPNHNEHGLDVIRKGVNSDYKIPVEHCPELVSLANTCSLLQAELEWKREQRPYYDVYPSVGEAFSKIDLGKIKCEQFILPLEHLMIRFQVGHELQASPRMQVRSILACKSTVYKTYGKVGGLLISINHISDDKPNLPTVVGISLFPGDTIEERLAKGREFGESPDDRTDHEGVDSCVRLVLALCLLKDNPDLINPEPLEADREKWEKTHDPKILEKAARRGKRCWSIGKHIEVAPGFRRPHFAIRWCGKGGTDPQLRPIKGCLVRRQKIEEVPTGYLDVPLEAIVLED